MWTHTYTQVYIKSYIYINIYTWIDRSRESPTTTRMHHSFVFYKSGFVLLQFSNSIEEAPTPPLRFLPLSLIFFHPNKPPVQDYLMRARLPSFLKFERSSQTISSPCSQRRCAVYWQDSSRSRFRSSISESVAFAESSSGPNTKKWPSP